MSRIHLILLAALSGIAIVPVMNAQTPADSPITDSATPAPARKSGGLFGRVKKMASSKVVQGVAKGVACNAVPGAAVAAAAAGSDACPAGGMGGMGGTGSATSVVGGAVGGALGATGTLSPGAAKLPDGGAMPSMTGMMPGAGGVGAMGGMGAMGMPSGSVKLNESAAAKCLGLSVQEVRDVMNTAPDAAATVRAGAVREKLMQRAQQGAQAYDVQACATMWEAK